jgi:hypothetical protein
MHIHSPDTIIRSIWAKSFQKLLQVTDDGFLITLHAIKMVFFIPLILKKAFFTIYNIYTNGAWCVLLSHCYCQFFYDNSIAQKAPALVL